VILKGGTEANPYFRLPAEVGFSFPSESGSKEEQDYLAALGDPEWGVLKQTLTSACRRKSVFHSLRNPEARRKRITSLRSVILSGGY
jgi:hypothetical protein